MDPIVEGLRSMVGSFADWIEERGNNYLMYQEHGPAWRQKLDDEQRKEQAAAQQQVQAMKTQGLRDSLLEQQVISARKGNQPKKVDPTQVATDVANRRRIELDNELKNANLMAASGGMKEGEETLGPIVTSRAGVAAGLKMHSQSEKSMIEELERQQDYDIDQAAEDRAAGKHTVDMANAPLEQELLRQRIEEGKRDAMPEPVDPEGFEFKPSVGMMDGMRESIAAKLFATSRNVPLSEAAELAWEDYPEDIQAEAVEQGQLSVNRISRRLNSKAAGVARESISRVEEFAQARSDAGEVGIQEGGNPGNDIVTDATAASGAFTIDSDMEKEIKRKWDGGEDLTEEEQAYVDRLMAHKGLE